MKASSQVVAATLEKSNDVPSNPGPGVERAFVTFDGGVEARAFFQQPDRYRHWSGVTGPVSRISQGAGLSYSAASFLSGGVTISHASFNRITDFDSVSGIVEVEPGITLFELYRFLLANRLYLPIQPGHGRITVGGCIAADTHGKNQARDGTFINQVESLTLFHPHHGLIELSRDKEPDLFVLTCGGYGLTGHILRARLRASRIPSGLLRIKASAFEGCKSGLEQLVAAASNAEFAYTWHDMLSTGKGVGGGYVFQGCFEQDSDFVPPRVLDDAPPLSSDGRRALPFAMLNSVSARVVNRIFRFQQRGALDGKQIELGDALFPAHKAQAYFTLFGARGFHEYQAILPLEAMQDYVESARRQAQRKSVTITLASAKAFAGETELLRFTGHGICLALNVPRTHGSVGFLQFLDERIIKLGGIPNIIKDSRLPRAVVDACYVGADEFRKALRAFDPHRIFQSELSERLGL
jgi:decaprenylphospho-beta-D-ribofuranose 2-oxidase